jgi:hypothetical protein
MAISHRAMLALLLTVSVSACSSFRTVMPPPLVATSQDSRFNEVISNAVRQHDSYVELAKATENDALWISGIGIAATMATLGFASFDAHPDNLKASALIAGSALAFNNQLKPVERTRFLVAAANGVRCVTDRTLQVVPRGAAPPIALGAPPSAFSIAAKGSPLLNNMSLSPDPSYAEVDGALVYLLSLAPSVVGPSPQLQKAVKDGEAARDRLKSALVAQASLPNEVSTALIAIRAAVAARAAPDLAALLKEIGAVKPTEKAAPVEDAGAATTAQALSMLGGPALVGTTTDLDKALVFAIGLLIERVDVLQPEREQTAVNGIKACVAEFSAATK